MIAGAEANQAGHAYVEGVGVFDVLLAAQRMHDRRGKLFCQRHNLVMCIGAARTRQNRHGFGFIENIHQPLQILLGRDHARGTDIDPGGFDVWRRQ